MRKKEGFTLIELLAVIVILAIIALIATPIVLNIISKAERAAAKSSAHGVVEAAKLYYTTNILDGKYTGDTFDFSDFHQGLLEVTGTKPDGGVLQIDTNGNMKGKLLYGKYTFYICNEKVAEEDIASSCELGFVPSPPEDLTYKKYDNGTVVYYNPETNLLCSEGESFSFTGTKTGCMKWYIFNDSEKSGFVNMILDHNTTASVAWNSSGNTSSGMKEVAEALANDSSTWHSTVRSTVRLIEADEIAYITGNTKFSQITSNSNQWFFFHNNTQNEVALLQGENQYKWLFNYTTACRTYGCDIEGIKTYGYWTANATSDSTDLVWYVNRKGLLYSYYANYGSDYGVRPVITISKSILEKPLSEIHTYSKYNNGTVVYYNPETNLICSESEVISVVGAKTGCMKWYIFNDSEKSSAVNMILDHNTTASVAWNSKGNNSSGMQEVADALVRDTSTWHSMVRPTVRLIEADEIAEITGNTQFSQITSNSNRWFFFHNNTQNEVTLPQGENPYKWLFNYMNGCSSYGCDIAAGNTYGYWTASLTSGSTNLVWYVNRKGLLYSYYANYGSDYGVRPVVTISKSLLGI